jgi:O-antigen/teichoic acid export membrane protein
VTSVRGSLFLSFAEKYSILLINIVATVILARLLTPAETGLYSVAAGLINVAQTLRDFGVGNYIVQESDLTRRRLSTALGISLILGATIALGFVAAAGPLALAFQAPRLRIVVLIMSLNFILVAFAAIGTARLHRDMKFRAALRIGIAAAIAHAATSIIMASQGYGAVGMAWASVMGISVYVAGNYICYAEDILLRPALTEWRRVLGFGVLVSGGTLLQEAGQRVADVVVGRFLGFSAAGLYSRANGLVSLFQQAMMDAITPVALSALALLNRNAGEVKAPFLRLLGYTTLVAWPLLAMIALLALPIIQVAFGPQWLAAVQTARILCLAAALGVLGRVAVTLFTAMGAARRLFRVQLMGIPILVLAVCLGATISIEAAAWGTVAGTLVHALYAVQQAKTNIELSWRQIGRVLGASLLVASVSLAVPVAIVLGYGVSSAHFWPQTIAAGTSGVTAWFLYIFALGHPFCEEIRLAWRHPWSPFRRLAVAAPAAAPLGRTSIVVQRDPR